MLKEIGKGDVSELDVGEASQVIDALKKVEVEGERGGPSRPTPKQLSFLQNLQDTEERIRSTDEFLEKHDKPSIADLSVPEASELIDVLAKLKGGQRLDTSENPATEKQLNFIKRLQKSEDAMKVYNSLMRKFRKSSLADVTKGEASELIEKMKEKT